MNEDECEKANVMNMLNINAGDVCIEVEGYKLGQVLQEYPTSR